MDYWRLRLDQPSPYLYVLSFIHVASMCYFPAIEARAFLQVSDLLLQIDYCSPSPRFSILAEISDSVP